MKKATLILALLTLSAYLLYLCADTITILSPANSLVESQVSLSDTINSNIHVTYVDESKEKWSWYKILSLVGSVIVPLGSVWLAWKLNKDNNRHSLERQRQEMKYKHDEELLQKKLQKQGEILEALNTLDSRFRAKDYPSTSDIKNVSDCILVAYPFIGKDLYDIANNIVATIETYIAKSHTGIHVYSTEDNKAIKEKLAEYINIYNKNVNGKESII